MKSIAVAGEASIDGLRLVERPVPEPGPGELLVRIRASSLNFHDYLVASGALPVAEGRIPLSDGAGEVVAVGTGVSNFAVGDRVLGTFFPDWVDGAADAHKVARMRGEHLDGFASEYVVVPATSVTRSPASLSDLEAATLPCAGLTAWRALMVEGGVRPGETVLVQGSGGVSIFALQFAKMAGARVIALTSSQERAARLQELGADAVVNYREEPRWASQVRELTAGKGANHVVEVVGGDLEQTVQACAVSGSIYLIGSLSRQPIRFPSGLMVYRNARLISLTVGSREHQQQMVQAVEANGLKPVVDQVFPLEEIRDAFRHQESRGHFGKICLSY